MKKIKIELVDVSESLLVLTLICRLCSCEEPFQ